MPSLVHNYVNYSLKCDLKTMYSILKPSEFVKISNIFIVVSQFSFRNIFIVGFNGIKLKTVIKIKQNINISIIYI